MFAEMNLTSFEFWAGAKDRAKILTYEELDEIGNVLESIYEEAESVTINNLFWFEFKSAVEWLGYKYNEEEDRIIRRRIKRRRSGIINKNIIFLFFANPSHIAIYIYI